ncbi:MAG: MFS transporter [Simkaniaceae bacterium]
MHRSHKKISIVGLAIWSLATLFFFYEFFLRVVLGTFANRLMIDLHLGAEEFSILGAAYYFTYSIMQTPVGLLVDRFGVRLLVTFATAICAFGVLWFSFSDTFLPALISRLLIGFGSAFAFVALLVLALNWFPVEQFSIFAGTAQFLGAIGPLLAGGPTALLLNAVNGNWRLILLGVGFFGLALAVLLGIFIRNRPKGCKTCIVFIETTEPLKQRLQQLFQNKQVWIIVLFAACAYVSMPLLGAYWGTTYMESRGFSKSAAATITSMIWLGLATGSLSLGKISDLLKRRKPVLCSAALLGTIISAIILYISPDDEYVLVPLFFLLGFSSAAQVVSFPTIAEHVPKKLHSTAIGFNNTVITLFAGILPPFASSLIQEARELTPHPTGLLYTQEDFTIGLSLMPIVYIAAFFIALIGIRETYCRQQHEVHKISR